MPSNPNRPTVKPLSEAAKDPNLSFEARGLLLFLSSSGNAWRINREQLYQLLRPLIGKERLNKRLNELISAGYITYVPPDLGKPGCSGVYWINTTSFDKESQ